MKPITLLLFLVVSASGQITELLPTAWLSDSRAPINANFAWLNSSKMNFSSGDPAPSAVCTGKDLYWRTATSRTYWCPAGAWLLIPVFGDAVGLNVGTSAGTVAAGDDARIVAGVSHAANTANPHAVTKTQVGLSAVPNTDATNATNIGTGTLADARLSGNVVVKNGAGNVVIGPTVLSASNPLVTFGSGLLCFGDSITYGSLSTVPQMNGYCGLLAGDVGGTYTNYAVSGHQAADVSLLNVYPNSNPQSSHSPVSVVMIGANDASYYGSNADKKANYTNFLNGILTWLSIPRSNKVLGTDAGVTTTGTWTTDALGVLGTQSLANGALTSGTSWTQSGDMALAANAATYTHSTGVGSLLQASTEYLAQLQPSLNYALTYTISGLSGTAPACTIGTGVASVATALNLAAGVNITYFQSTSAVYVSAPGSLALSCTSSGAGAFTIDTLSLKVVNGVLGIKSSTNASTASFSLTTYGAPIYLGYKLTDSNGGTASVTVDGVAAGTVTATGQNGAAILTNTPATTSGIGILRYPVAAGVHAVVITVTSATSGSNVVAFEWAGTAAPAPKPTGSPRVFVGGVTQNTGGDTNAAAYNVIVQGVAAQLLADGLPVFYVATRDYLNTATDLADGVHPNNLGHQHLRDAFVSSINPSGFGSKGIVLGLGESIRQWDPNAVAGAGTVLPIIGLSSTGILNVLAGTGKYMCLAANAGNDGCQIIINTGGGSVQFLGTAQMAKMATISNCASSAAPAVCGSAPSGGVVVAAAATTVVVNTTAISTYGQVLVTFDASLGTKLGVTCNTTPLVPYISARSTGVSFTITLPSAPSVNPACLSYTILN